MDKKMPMWVILTIWFVTNVGVFHTRTFLPLGLYLAVLVIYSTWLGCIAYRMAVSRKEMTVHLFIYFIEDSARSVGRGILNVWSKMDAIAPCIFIILACWYAVPWVIDSGFLNVSQTTATDVVTISHGIGNLFLAWAIILASVSFLRHVVASTKLNTYTITVALQEIQKLGALTFVHRNGRMCVDWDKVLDDLAHSRDSHAKMCYAFVHSHYKYLNNTKFNVLKPPVYISTELYNWWKQRYAKTEEAQENAE